MIPCKRCVALFAEAKLATWRVRGILNPDEYNHYCDEHAAMICEQQLGDKRGCFECSLECEEIATDELVALDALRAFKETEQVIRQHNLLSTATDEERRETIARLIHWWNKYAAPILAAVDLEAIAQKYDHYNKGGDHD